MEKHFFWWKEQIILPKNIFLAQFEIVLNFHYFCKVRACWISVKNSIFQKLPKIVEKHFFWWGEQKIYPKNIFFTQFEIVLNFHYFCKVRACRISVKNSNFQKLPKIVEKHFFSWKEQIILPKNIFLAQFKIVLNLHYFCKVRACRISVKISNFKKLPKIVEKHFFWWKEQIILPKNIFLAQLEIVLNFHYFCKVRACWISVKNSNFQKSPKIVEKHFFWWKEQKIYSKNIFLAQLEIVLNFHYFCKVSACWISVKNSNFQKLPKIVEKHFFWWKEQIILSKIFFFTQLEIVLNFHYFCNVRACWISVKNSIFQKLPKIVEKHFFWWKEQIILPKNIFLAQFEIVLNFHYFCKVRACWISVKNCLKLWRNTLMRGTNNLSKKYFLHTI